MEKVQTSSYYSANKFVRFALESYEEMVGKNGLNAILNLAGLSSLIDNFPPDTLEREFEFVDFTAFHIALEEMYGSRGGQGLAQRAGRSTFNHAILDLGSLPGLGDPAFNQLPLEVKLRMSLPVISLRIFSQIADHSSIVEEKENEFVWTFQHCPICWTRMNAEKPVCYLLTGMLQATMMWASAGLEFPVNETQCCAVGDPVCEFVTQKEPLSPKI